MSDFSDAQDHALIQLVLKCEGPKGIDWKTVEAKFPKRAKSRDVLRQRLKTLKRTYGGNVRAFPPRFFRVQAEKCLRKVVVKARTSPQLVVAQVATPLESIASRDATAASEVPFPPQLCESEGVVENTEEGLSVTAHGTVEVLNYSVASELAHFAMTFEAIVKVLASMFEEFSLADVRQPSGLVHLNAGELAPKGVTAMINALEIGPNDTFGDVGSGSGSVISQVALQTTAKKCVGLEIRANVAEKSQKILHNWTQSYSRLSMIQVVHGDIRVHGSVMSSCTIIFANNQLFNPQANYRLQVVICESPIVHSVIIGEKFCHRCTSRCSKEFCQMWELKTTVEVEVCWSSKLASLHIYHRRTLS